MSKTKLVRVVAGAALVAGVVVGVGSPASADKPAEFSFSVTFPDINPCSGEPFEVTIDTDVRLHIHGENSIAHESSTGSTDDGYVMDHRVLTHVFNGNVHRDAFVDNWYNDDGSRFQARGVFVETEDEVLVEKHVLRCVSS